MENKEELKFIDSLQDRLETHELPTELYIMIYNIFISFGYKITEKDTFQICITVLKIKEKILSYCNTEIIPEGYLPKMATMICGDFLIQKRQSGNLDLKDLDFSDEGIATLKEGDLSITFDVDVSDYAKFDKLLDVMASIEDGDLLCYRKLKW